jgi:Zn-dependent protease with chaperone function
VNLGTPSTRAAACLEDAMSLAPKFADNANGVLPVSATLSAKVRLKFPDLLGPGPRVDARACETPGNALQRGLAYAVFAVAALALVAVSFGTVLLFAPLALLLEPLYRRRIEAQIRGTCLEVGPNQLPELHACAKAFAERLGLKEVPQLYIVESNTANAAAVRLGSRNLVFLVDDAVWGALKAGDPNALSFLIAHELAHHALGHTSALQTGLALAYRRLSRLNELSCDAVALQLVGNKEAAYNGIIMLTVGPQLAPYVNRAAPFAHAEMVVADSATRKAEKTMTHPLVARRLWELRRVGR